MCFVSCVLSSDRNVGPKFGNQPNKTCKDSPVIRIFNYTCDADQNPTADYVYTVDELKTEVPKDFGLGPTSNLGQKWYNFLIDKGFKDTDSVCVYQPRVQVLDNWGWCTGECVTSYDANGSPVANATKKNGCYDDFNYDSASQELVDHQCYPDNKQAGLDQWKYFDNIIVVAPGK